MNAFAVLGIGERLVISEEELREAFREAGKSAHPDAGGGEGAFAELKAAMEILSSPSKRLRHWLSLRGMEVEARGMIGGELMELFSEVGATMQGAEALLRKRDEAKSALGRAMLEGETQRCREAVEAAVSKVTAGMDEVCAGFPMLESSGEIEGETVARWVRDLAFLEKWRVGLRGIYSRLV